MQVETHRKTDDGFTFNIGIVVLVEDAGSVATLLDLGEQTGGNPTTVTEEGDGYSVCIYFAYGPIPFDPETGKPLMTEKEYAEMQVREAGLLIQSALDSASQGKGKKLASEGTTIAV